MPVNAGLFPIIARRDPSHRADIAFLSESLEFLKNLRSAYRLTVGAEDRLRSEYFGIVARAMRLEYADEPDVEGRLLNEYDERTTRVSEVVTELAAGLEGVLQAEREP